MTAKYRLLVVDDEPHTPRVLKLKLETEGWEVRIARNGAEALKLLEEGPLPDALLTDMVMPVMDGKALCHAVAERYPQRPFPIFLASSLVERDVREWSAALGGIVFLEKPVSPRKIAIAIERSLARSSSGSA